ncbi:MAG: helix-hairpin-helix domain-containing protein [Pirellula sp.]|jgi:hypothetical protein
MPKRYLTQIPGIGATYINDFARIRIFAIEDLVDQDPRELYKQLCIANERVQHKTTKNYLYVFRIAVYYANGGREENKLKCNAWKDRWLTLRFLRRIYGIANFSIFPSAFTVAPNEILVSKSLTP